MPSQNGEDRKLAEILGDLSPGFYLDIGANDPSCCSVSEYFYNFGWNGIAIEPNIDFKSAWEKNRSRDIFIPYAAGRKEDQMEIYSNENSQLSSLRYSRSPGKPVIIKTINRILEEYKNKTEFSGFPYQSFSCIDVEGWEKEVLLGWDLDKWRPRAICIESMVPYPSPLVYNYEEWEYILLDSGYKLASKDTWNRYYLTNK